MNAMVEASTAETVARRRASAGSGFASGLSVVVAALNAAVLLAGALVVMASLVLAAVIGLFVCGGPSWGEACPLVPATPCGRGGSRPLTVTDGTATVVRTAEGNAWS